MNAVVLVLSAEEARTLARAAWVARTLHYAGRLDFDIDPQALDAVEGAIEEQLTETLCEHCRMGTQATSTGLCDACRAYENKYGYLPNRLTLDKRSRRKVRRNDRTSDPLDRGENT